MKTFGQLEFSSIRVQDPQIARERKGFWQLFFMFCGFLPEFGHNLSERRAREGKGGPPLLPAGGEARLAQTKDPSAALALVLAEAATRPTVSVETNHSHGNLLSSRRCVCAVIRQV